MQVAAKFPNAGAKLIVMCGDGGANSAEATEALLAAGYSAAAQLAGGWAAYTQVWGPSGKRRPPAGRWVSTGEPGGLVGRHKLLALDERACGALLAKLEFSQWVDKLTDSLMFCRRQGGAEERPEHPRRR